MKCRVLESGNCEITQGYNGNHHANDIVGGGYTLDNVVAHSEGKIIFFQDGYDNMQGSTGNASYGNCVKIDHGNGYYTLYAHMQKGLSVKNGDYVKKGQILGYMGNSGNSTAGHLHFEVWQGNNRIDPTNYLDSDLPSAEKDYTGVITYQGYTNEWLPEVNKCGNTDDGYIGIYGTPLTAFRCKPQYGELIYEVHTLNGEWIGAVNSNDYSKGNGDSFAGYLGKPIDGIRIKSTKGWVRYRVHILGGDWLDWAEGFGDSGNEYGGIYGQVVDGIQMY